MLCVSYSSVKLKKSIEQYKEGDGEPIKQNENHHNTIIGLINKKINRKNDLNILINIIIFLTPAELSYLSGKACVKKKAPYIKCNKMSLFK